MKVIKDIIANFKLSLDFHKSGRQLGSTQELELPRMTYNVYVHDGAMSAMAHVPPRVPCGAVITVLTIFGGTRPAYLVNNAFMKAPVWVQEAIMTHEEAHIHYKDHLVKISTLDLLLRNFREPEYEKRADRYAFEILGAQYIEFLEYMKKYKLPNVQKRINALTR